MTLPISPSLVLGIAAGVGSASMNMDKLSVAVPMSSGSHASVVCPAVLRWQNFSLLQTIREIDRRRSGTRFSVGDTSEDMLRQARAGGMYGLDPCE
jgi:hypothetical protein